LSRRPYDAKYKNWRKAVIVRDNFECQFESSKHSGKLQVHHIKKWYNHTHLRYCLSNGITLCRRHHRMITGREEDFERMFIQKVGNNFLFDIQQLMYDLDKK